MQSRREFLIMSAAAGALSNIAVGPGFAKAATVKAVTAITQVFGDGLRLIAVAIECDGPVDGAQLSASSFTIEVRTVTGAFPSHSADPADRADAGAFVIVTLSADDPAAVLSASPQGGGARPEGAGDGKPPQGAGGPKGPKGPGGGVGNAGDIPTYDAIFKPATARVAQVEPLMLTDGQVIAPGGVALVTTGVKNLIADDFQQLEFRDEITGNTLLYNLFVPKDYDAGKSYPLVLFMHDAGATSDITTTTLYQGLGAIAWASPEDQAMRPAFVLAPQFSDIIADDDSRTSSSLDTTIDLIKALLSQYSIDENRLYTTGQSGGCMMSIAMNIKYPDFFAAAFLVAGQWDPALVTPLAHKKLWILVSQDDGKAFPGENAITEALAAEGARISRAVWDGTWSAEQYQFAFDDIDAEASPINYTTFNAGTVIPKGQTSAGASGHRNTWRIAYSIEPIRAWIFRQHN
ncbi:MAG TPA: PHB depolymerase family esterase [Paenirhodobacter sp.]